MILQKGKDTDYLRFMVFEEKDSVLIIFGSC